MKHFLFSPLFGEDFPFDEHIFQMGWFNHQLGEVVLLDTGGSVVMELKKDPNQIWVTHWMGALDAPGMSGFDGVHSVPLADPLLITFFISNQFRNKGLFSPFTDLILWTLFTGEP